MDEETNELYSMDATITVEASKAVNLKAYFVLDVETVLIKVNTEGMGQIAWAFHQDTAGKNPICRLGFCCDRGFGLIYPPRTLRPVCLMEFLLFTIDSVAESPYLSASLSA